MGQEGVEPSPCLADSGLNNVPIPFWAETQTVLRLYVASRYQVHDSIVRRDKQEINGRFVKALDATSALVSSEHSEVCLVMIPPVFMPGGFNLNFRKQTFNFNNKIVILTVSKRDANGVPLCGKPPNRHTHSDITLLLAVFVLR